MTHSQNGFIYENKTQIEKYQNFLLNMQNLVPVIGTARFLLDTSILGYLYAYRFLTGFLQACMCMCNDFRQDAQQQCTSATTDTN